MRCVYVTYFLVLALYVTWSHGETMKMEETIEGYGEIESPDFPRTYNNNLDMTWEISTKPGYQIVVRFTVFDLEDSYDETKGGSCVYDYVEVEDWGTRKRLCGNSKKHPYHAPKSWQEFRSENNSMTIRFVSDYSNDLEYSTPLIGFNAHYKVEDKNECKEMERKTAKFRDNWETHSTTQCNHHCINVPGSYYCTCRSGFQLHDNNHTCTGLCQDIVINDDEGVIESPDYPQPYPRLTDCDWTIQAKEGESLKIQFDTNFAIEHHANQSDCGYDWLKITLNGEEQLYCRDAPYNGSFFETNLREVRLDLHSDHALEMAGFRMGYTTKTTYCPNPPNAPANGKITSNPKGFYTSGNVITFKCNCGYNLEPPSGENVTCLSDGLWNKLAPTCQTKTKTRCLESRDAPANGRISTSTSKDYYESGDKITFGCSSGYTLEPLSGKTVTCLSDGTWDRPAPTCQMCGIKNPSDTNRIERAITEPNEWPWMAYLNFGEEPLLNGHSNFCGGVLISSGYVLTAAHCLRRTPNRTLPNLSFYNKSEVFVWLGIHDRSERVVSETRRRLFRVAEIVMHTLYNNRTQNYDFALLRLNETVVMGERIRHICLPSKPEHFELLNSVAGTVAGWGRFEEYDIDFGLQAMEVEFVSNSECWKSFVETQKSKNSKIPIDSFRARYSNFTDKMFCGDDGSEQEQDVCKGDSGGPYMRKFKLTEQYYALGLVSDGLSQTACGPSESYTVFAKIDQSIADWIRGVMETPPS